VIRRRRRAFQCGPVLGVEPRRILGHDRRHARDVLSDGGFLIWVANFRLDQIPEVILATSTSFAFFGMSAGLTGWYATGRHCRAPTRTASTPSRSSWISSVIPAPRVVNQT